MTDGARGKLFEALNTIHTTNTVAAGRAAAYGAYGEVMMMVMVMIN